MTCANVNTFPVLATHGDDAMLGAAIMLPDHPQLAPERRGDLFDCTEIEEALLLHVLALTDDERAAIARADPAVRAMVARAAAATPEDIMALHGRMTLPDPAPDADAEPPRRARGRVDGVTYRLGAKRRPAPRRSQRPLRPHPRRPQRDHRAHLLSTTRSKLYFGVTVDDDPGQELMRDTGRYLFFFPGELEVVDS